MLRQERSGRTLGSSGPHMKFLMLEASHKISDWGYKVKLVMIQIQIDHAREKLIFNSISSGAKQG
jgi:hypothetical protein